MPSAKPNEKNKAIRLRKKGLSYSEIESQVNVSRASLSLWLRDIPLSDTHKERLYKKQLVQHERAWYLIRQRRIEKTDKIYRESSAQIGTISIRELWLLGIALYWAEGSKAKEHNVSQGVVFSNSDPMMIRLFLDWLRKCVGINDAEILYSLYLHQTAKCRLSIIMTYWFNILCSNVDLPVYYKKGLSQSYRKNRGDNYYGVLRITVRRSSELNRKISGWIKGICDTE